jgi:hypothetical protein
MMRRMLQLLAFAVIAALSATALTASAADARVGRAAPTVTLRVRAIDRNGDQAQFTAWEINDGIFQDAVTQLSASSGNRLVPGRYTIGAIVATMADGTDVANTLVVRTVVLRHNATVTLSALNSVPVTISLDGEPEQANLAAVVCVHNLTPPGAINYLQLMSWAPSQQASLNPPLYVTPYRASNVTFGYGTWAQGDAGQDYNLAQSYSGGLPASPAARFSAASLARVTLQAPTGEFSGTNSGGYEFQGAAGVCSGVPEYNDPLNAVSIPSTTSQYFSPGTWGLGLNSFNDHSQTYAVDQVTARFAGGHDYTEVFNGAAWGPAYALPGLVPYSTYQANELGVIYFPLLDLFNDPVGSGFDTAAQAVVSLSSRGKVLMRTRYRSLAGNPVTAYFGYGLHRSGWYSMQVIAHRRDAVLSPEVTLGWRFYASDSPSTSYGQYPVSYTQFRVLGLDLNNDAAPRATTSIDVTVVRDSAQFALNPPRDYGWRQVTVLASSDGGKTWHVVLTTRRGSQWTVTVHDPASGFVSLRSVAVNVKGDRTVETIYDAFGVS